MPVRAHHKYDSPQWTSEAYQTPSNHLRWNQLSIIFLSPLVVLPRCNMIQPKRILFGQTCKLVSHRHCHDNCSSERSQGHLHPSPPLVSWAKSFNTVRLSILLAISKILGKHLFWKSETKSTELVGLFTADNDKLCHNTKNDTVTRNWKYHQRRCNIRHGGNCR